MSEAKSRKPNPRKNADDAYEAFMSMPDSEWHGLIMSVSSGGVLEVEENKGFERAMKARSIGRQETAMSPEQTTLIKPLVIHTKALIVAQTAGVTDLKINGVDDKAGLEVVYRKRLDLAKIKSAIEKEREAQKKYWLEGGRAVDSEAKELQSILAPALEHLIAQETAIVNEKARLAKIKEDEKRDARVKRLTELGWTQELEPYSDDYLRSWTEADFELICARMVTRVADKKLADEARAKQEAEAKAEADRMRAERESLDKQRKEQEAEAARLQKIQDDIARDKLNAEMAERARVAAEAKRVEDARLAVERAAQLERAKAESAEKARVETEQRIAREAKEKAEREQAERDELARQEALKPDRDKLLAVADALQAIPFPEVSQAMSESLVRINRVIVAAAREIRDIANEK